MDDGIELNFASAEDAGSAVLRRQTPQKGGRWTDRVKARKAVRQTVKQYERANGVVTPPSVPELTPSFPQRPAAPKPSVPVVASRPNQVVPAAGLPTGPSASSPAASRFTRMPVQPKPTRQPDIDPSQVAGPSRIPVSQPIPSKNAKAPQIISSLFTSNPSSARIKTASAVSTPGAPSNAPLAGDTSTFEGLGLDPLLRRHLKEKMKVDRPTGIQRSALPFMLSSPLDIDRSMDSDEPVQPLRDIFVQSQTGSGKTLAYLLPIVQTLLPLSRLSYIDRSIGTLAIILAPTRELAQQISKVLEQILSMSLSSGEDEQMTRWLVSGLLTGGSTKTHEKARLRKGVPILVSTPGRLLDHLQNTASFKCAKTLFLVLDEADRVMDLGFEETITGIIKALEGRRKIEIAVEKEMEEEGGGVMRWPFWGRGRQTVLCSATVDAKVEQLSGVALRNPVVFRDTDKADKEKPRGKEVEIALHEASTVTLPQMSLDKFTPPSQLSQKYVVTPTKLRLVALVALLRSLVAAGENTKIIVFLSSTDAVDFHWRLLGGVRMEDQLPAAPSAPAQYKGNVTKNLDTDSQGGDPSTKPMPTKAAGDDLVSLDSPLFQQTSVHRLHGPLPLRTRMASLAAFSVPSSKPSILLATSVASRGLDLPLVRAVVQYDLPTEGGANEYVHRVGRTARAGKGGEAWAFVAPSEVDWVTWVEGKMGAVEGKGVKLSQVGVEDVLKKGFGGKGYEYEGRATDVQLAFERWVLIADPNAALARKAFSSYVRAYSTHPLEEKKFFHPKSLHLGHLAKSFALREAPGQLAASGSKSSRTVSTDSGKRKRAGSDDEEAETRGGKEIGARNETEKRMYAAVRKAGRVSKSGGTMGEYSGVRRGGPTAGSGAAGEFQVMGTGELESMLGGRKGVSS